MVLVRFLSASVKRDFMLPVMNEQMRVYQKVGGWVFQRTARPAPVLGQLETFSGKTSKFSEDF